MDFEFIDFDKSDGIATVTLNRPDKLNALTPQMRVEMRKAFEDVAEDDGIRVLILTGAGRGFCAGADITTVAARAELADDESMRALHLQPVATNRPATILRNLKKPTICALNGIIAGGPIALALSCDIIIASDKARFRMALTRVGLSLENGISYMLSQRIGPHLTLLQHFIKCSLTYNYVWQSPRTVVVIPLSPETSSRNTLESTTERPVENMKE